MFRVLRTKSNRGNKSLGSGFGRTRRYRPQTVVPKKRGTRGSEDDAGISGFLRRGFSIFRGINPSGHEETSEMAKRGPVLKLRRARGDGEGKGGQEGRREPIQFS